jgi:hypothetical protein
MADQWEVCSLTRDFSPALIIYSPEGRKEYGMVDFIKKYDPSFSKPSYEHKKQEVFEQELQEMSNRFFRLFMSEGWEPYSVTSEGGLGSYYHFRRKYQDENMSIKHE